MGGQSDIVNKEIIQVRKVCKAEGNETLRKIPEIQLRLNSSYNASCRNNTFVRVLGLDVKQGLDTFAYPINNYEPAMKRHNAMSQALPNAKARKAKQGNLYCTLEPQHKVGDNVI